jgi:peptide/nickel transport system substrate-binding protein
MAEHMRDDHMSRRRFLQLLSASVGASVLAACGGTSAPVAPSGDTNSAPAADTNSNSAPTAAPAADTGAAATSAPAASGSGAKKLLRIGYGGEIDTLNPFTSQFLIDIHLTMMEGLIVSNDKNEYIAVLAKEIPTVENGGVKTLSDGKTEITWKLQEGVKWHDGTDFTSDDVVYTWKFITAEGSEVYNRDEYMPISKCEAVDKYTVKMTWDKPFAAYASLFESVLPKHVMEKQDPKTGEFNRNPIGTGPFKFTEWKSGEYIRVSRNPDYWRGKEYPSVDEVVFTFIPDNNTRLNALKAGEQDWGQITPDQAKEVENLAGYKTILVDQNSWNHFDTNIKTEHGKLLFSDKQVRQALAFAIDRNAIADGIMQGTVKVADTVVAPSSPYFNPDVPKYNYDPEKAKQMLDAAGWTVGADGIRAKDGQKFSFTIMNRAGRTDRIAIAQVIQAQLKDVGIEVGFETQESAAWSGKWRNGEWEAVVSGWVLPADPSFTSLFACDGGNNMTGYCSEELDKYMNESDTKFELSERKPLLDKAQVLLAEEAFSLPLYYNVTPTVVSDRLGNFKPSGTNLGSFWNVYEWTLS